MEDIRLNKVVKKKKVLNKLLAVLKPGNMGELTAYIGDSFKILQVFT